jgi:hypothetical protein
MSFTTIDIQRFIGNAIEKASIENKVEIKFDVENFMKTMNDKKEDVRPDTDIILVEKNTISKEQVKAEKLAAKEAKEQAKAEKLAAKEADKQAKADKLAAKEAKEQAKADKLAAKEAEKQAKADKLAAKEAEKQAKEQAKADKLAAKESEKQAKEQAKAEKLAAKETKKKDKDVEKTKGKRGRPKKENVVVASGDYIENVEAQSVDLVQNLAQEVATTTNTSSTENDDSSSVDDADKFEDVQVHLFEFDGTMYYKSDDHVLYHHESQEEIGNWDPIENEIVLK